MINKSSKILIGGDSWGLGEWDWDPDHRIVHKGITQYFNDDGYQEVFNCSAGGSSNKEAIDRLAYVIADYNPDYIFWFQTDPIRDLRPYTDYIIKSYQQLVDDHETLINTTYRKLNSLGVQIHCIGGCSKLNLMLLEQYSNLTALIPSCIELLTDRKHPEFWCTDWASSLDPELDYESTNLLYDMFCNPPLNLEQNYPKFFKPDGYHPNRHGHRVIYKYIQGQL